MLTILLNWLVISIISFPIGFLILSKIGKAFHYQFRDLKAYLLAGLVFDTVYAQIFSLFGSVRLTAVIILAVAALVSWIIEYKKIKEAASGFYKKWSQEKQWYRIACLVLLLLGVVLTAYGSSRGYMAYDTALYHAQAIRWIEEFGVVKGLGLLHCRFAYNSASFALSALFSFSFIPGIRMHCISGYFLVLIYGELPQLMKIVERKHLKGTDFVRIGIFYYYTLAFGQIVAPTSDFPATILIFYIILHFMELLERKEENTTPYSLLCVLVVFGITIKLSIGLLVLLTAYPVYQMIKKKESQRILIYLGLGLMVALPFLIRGVLISGYLLYPQTVFDVFQVDWKIPAESARADMLEIQRWGRNLQFETQEMNSFKEWVPRWFMSQDFMAKVMLVLDVLGLPCAFVYSLVEGVFKKNKELWSWMFLWLLLYIAAGYWLVSAPLVRYGYAYVILPFLTVFGYLLAQWKRSFPIVGIAMILFMGYKILALGKNSIAMSSLPYYIVQQEYEEYETVPYQVGEYTFYRPLSGDQTGYERFPAAPYEFKGRLRGDELKDGFAR